MPNIPPYSAVTPHTREWFDDAFTNPVTREPYPVPADIRTAAERITSAYNIRGICDPMWIANVIARETGRGNGESVFFPEDAR